MAVQHAADQMYKKHPIVYLVQVRKNEIKIENQKK